MSVKTEKGKNEVLGGVALVFLGIILFTGQFISVPSLEMLILPFIATVLTAWGLITRHPGPFIPGGIIGGIALGVFLLEGPLWFANPDHEGGIFMLAFAAGWVSITLLTAVFTAETQWWALIPAAIMGLIGLGILTGGFLLTALSYASKLWPVILIALGVSIIIKAMQTEPKHK